MSVSKEGGVDECGALMGKKSIVGAEGGLRGRSLARHPDKRNFGFDSHIIPSGA